MPETGSFSHRDEEEKRKKNGIPFNLHPLLHAENKGAFHFEWSFQAQARVKEKQASKKRRSEQPSELGMGSVSSLSVLWNCPTTRALRHQPAPRKASSRALSPAWHSGKMRGSAVGRFLHNAKRAHVGQLLKGSGFTSRLNWFGLPSSSNFSFHAEATLSNLLLDAVICPNSVFLLNPNGKPSSLQETFFCKSCFE